MGKSAAITAQWLEKPVRVAALFNGAVFAGEQIIKPEELEPADGESHALIEDKNLKKKEINKFRDITMHWKQGATLVILAVENQNKIHYGMPVRIMSYDGQSYEKQMKLIWDSLSEEEKKACTAEEFLSRFRKVDRIYPVITLVFYYGIDEWDASLDLYDMFQFGEEIRDRKELQEYIPNYKINLIDAARLENLEHYGEELQKIFGLLKCRGDKEAILAYAEEHKEYFQHMDRETGLMVGEFLQSERIVKKMMRDSEEGDDMNMCKALEDLFNDGVEQGIEQGIRQNLKMLVDKKLKKGYSVDEIADILEESVGLIQELVNELNNSK